MPLNPYPYEKLGVAVREVASSSDSLTDRLRLFSVTRLEERHFDTYPEDVQKRFAELKSLLGSGPLVGSPAVKAIELLVALYGDVAEEIGRERALMESRNERVPED